MFQFNISGKHQDVRYTLSKVFGNNFWFGMKIDIKVFVNYCCNDNDGKCLNDRYFMFRSYFMKKVRNKETEAPLIIPPAFMPTGI